MRRLLGLSSGRAPDGFSDRDRVSKTQSLLLARRGVLHKELCFVPPTVGGHTARHMAGKEEKERLNGCTNGEKKKMTEYN